MSGHGPVEGDAPLAVPRCIQRKRTAHILTLHATGCRVKNWPGFSVTSSNWMPSIRALIKKAFCEAREEQFRVQNKTSPSAGVAAVFGFENVSFLALRFTPQNKVG